MRSLLTQGATAVASKTWAGDRGGPDVAVGDTTLGVRGKARSEKKGRGLEMVIQSYCELLSRGVAG